ncbi:hypothetical protein [Actinoalloteichus sp. AHMU CJ021]|uniref:hypothetical protein n=1 Tax=Actinoalloteichus sp. AHMU CJ021 TaxID=2072503 RepID=UPI00307C28B3
MLAVDVVDSAKNPGHHLNAVHNTLGHMVRESLAEVGLSPADILHLEPIGDETLVTLPSGTLGSLVDAAHRLDAACAHHNRWRKPEIRLRVAVAVGAVGDTPGYYAARIRLKRMLDSQDFRELFARCRQRDTEFLVNSALIVSDEVMDTVFGGDHTNLVRKGEFVRFPIRNKEHRSTAWVRVPGIDPNALKALTEPVDRSVPELRGAGRAVTNTVSGDNNGIQAGSITGGVTLNGGQR